MRLFFVENYQGTLEALQQAEQQGAPSSRLRSRSRVQSGSAGLERESSGRRAVG